MRARTAIESGDVDALVDALRGHDEFVSSGWRARAAGEAGVHTVSLVSLAAGTGEASVEDRRRMVRHLREFALARARGWHAGCGSRSITLNVGTDAVRLGANPNLGVTDRLCNLVLHFTLQVRQVPACSVHSPGRLTSRLHACAGGCAHDGGSSCPRRPGQRHFWWGLLGEAMLPPHHMWHIFHHCDAHQAPSPISRSSASLT